MTAGVYLLRDPTNGIVRYVGQSINLEARLLQHIYNPHSRLRPWIEELKLQGLRPKAEIVAVKNAADSLDAVEQHLVERYWEQSFNGTSGGRQGYGFREDVYASYKISPASLFCRVRDKYIDRFKAKLISNGVDRYRVQQGRIGNEITKRGFRYALRRLKNDRDTASIFKDINLDNHGSMPIEAWHRLDDEKAICIGMR